MRLTFLILLLLALVIISECARKPPKKKPAKKPAKKASKKAGKETGEEAGQTRKASRQTEASSYQLCKVDGSTYWWHLLVESGQQGLRHLQERWHAVRISYSEQMLQKASQSGLPRN